MVNGPCVIASRTHTDASNCVVWSIFAAKWTAIGQTELRCVQTMAYCLGELQEGRWPK
jgi:hypothetical protein